MSTLSLLGVKDTANLPKDTLDAGRLIDGMQVIYSSMPDNSKKEAFANMIAESVRILLIRLASIGAITQETIEKENQELPQEKRIAVQAAPMPKQNTTQNKEKKERKTDSEKQQEQKPKEEPKPDEEKKDVTLEDIKKTEKGDTIISYQSGNKVKMIVEFNGWDGLETRVTFNDSGKPRAEAYDWKFFDDSIKAGVKFEIIKAEKPKITLDDIKAMQVGDAAIVVFKAWKANIKITVVEKHEDYLLADMRDLDTDKLNLGVEYHWNWWTDRVEDGDVEEIIKAEKKPKITLEDVKKADIGDVIRFDFADIRQKVEYTITAKVTNDQNEVTGFVGIWRSDKASLVPNLDLSLSYLEEKIDLGELKEIIKSEKPKSNITIEDIKSLKLDDIVERLDKNEKYVVKGTNKQFLVVDITDFTNNRTDKDFITYWLYWENLIEQGAQFKITKSNKYATIEEIQAMDVGDKLQKVGETYYWKIEKKDGSDGFYVTVVDTEDGSEREDVYVPMITIKAAMSKGTQYIIIKGKQFATEADIDALEVGDTIENANADVIYKITGIAYDENQKKEAYYTTKTDNNTGELTNNFPKSIKDFKAGIKNGLEYVITKSGESKPETSQLPTTKQKKTRKKKTEEADDESAQTKKLLDKLKNLQF